MATRRPSSASVGRRGGSGGGAGASCVLNGGSRGLIWSTTASKLQEPAPERAWESKRRMHLAGSASGPMGLSWKERATKRVAYMGLLSSILETASYSRHKRQVKSAQREGDLRLHLGCGRRVLDGWINIDSRSKPGVLRMKLPRGLRRFDDGSARYIYASHLLEHLEYPAEASEFVVQCHRVLKPGGVLRIIVPGIEKIIRAYVRDDRAFFEIQKQIHPASCTTKLEHLMYALQQKGKHKYGYDFETMKKLLSGAGFEKIAESDCNKSEMDDLRIDYRAQQDDKGEYLSLYVDAIK
jgi:predicted SAM-dependent methyltransferase